MPWGLLTLARTGAIVGLFGGLAAWLLSSYRQRGAAGTVFVLLIILLLLLPVLFMMS